MHGEGQALALRYAESATQHGEGQALALRRAEGIWNWRGTGPRPTVKAAIKHGEGQALALRLGRRDLLVSMQYAGEGQAPGLRYAETITS